jgi:DNA ligase-1
MKTHPTIYKLDSKGNIRVWYIEQEGPRYRTVAGIEGGKLVTSEWTTAVPKGQPTGEAQADFEIQAEYKHKLTREYFANRENAAGGKTNFFKPMLAHPYADHAPVEFPVYCQPKLDGIRCITTRHGMFSREGKPILGAPHVLEALEPFFRTFPEAVLDGELYNHDLHDDFNEIVSCVKKQKPNADDLAKSRKLVQYHVYDLPSDFSSFGRRSEILYDNLPEHPALVLVSTHFINNQRELDLYYEHYLADNYEGQMVRANARYEQKRTKALLKRKEFRDEEFEVVEIQEGKGNWSGVAKSVLCRMKDGRTFGAGIKGTRSEMKKLLGETYSKVTVKYFCLTPDGIPRFPIAIKWHGQGARL